MVSDLWKKVLAEEKRHKHINELIDSGILKNSFTLEVHKEIARKTLRHPQGSIPGQRRAKIQLGIWERKAGWSVEQIDKRIAELRQSRKQAHEIEDTERLEAKIEAYEILRRDVKTSANT